MKRISLPLSVRRSSRPRTSTSSSDPDLYRAQLESQLRSVVDSHTAYLIRTDLFGFYSYVNQRFKDTFAFLEDDFIGKLSLDSILAIDHEACLQTVEKCLENPGTPVQVTLRKPRPDGSTMWTEWEFVTVTGANGQTEIQCLGFDITERKEAEAKLIEQGVLEAMLRKEQELGDLKNRMMTRIAHEFRTPLAVIQAAADMLMLYHDRLTSEKRREKLASIHEEVTRLTRLISDITHVVEQSQISADFKPAPFALDRMISEVVQRLSIVDKERHLIEVHAHAIKQINADPHLIDSLLVNLIGNALKYSPDESTVVITADAEGKDGVRLSVKDEGVGISPADLPHIFEPFYRSAAVHRVQGVGLGLNIVQYAVQAHQGSIEVRSEPGSGTTFIVHLPGVRQA